jgi:hypothetical protein
MSLYCWWSGVLVTECNIHSEDKYAALSQYDNVVTRVASD